MSNPKCPVKSKEELLRIFRNLEYKDFFSREMGRQGIIIVSLSKKGKNVVDLLKILGDK